VKGLPQIRIPLTDVQMSRRGNSRLIALKKKKVNNIKELKKHIAFQKYSQLINICCLTWEASTSDYQMNSPQIK